MPSIAQALKNFIVVTGIIILAGTSISVPSVPVEAKSFKHELNQAEQEDLKYPEEITSKVMKTLKKETKGPLYYEEALEIIERMKKVEVMDSYLDAYGKKVESEEIRRIVEQIYEIDLNRVSELGAGKDEVYPEEIIEGVKAAAPDADLSSLTKVEVMDFYLESYGEKIDGQEIRRVINQIFGINLDGISSLEGSRVSLYSKDQWISQYDGDLFVVHTGLTDVDVWIYPTAYFTQQTGASELPEDLRDELLQLGFEYNEQVEAYYYENPEGESVSDEFKGRTLGTVIQFIQMNYSDL
ncbi:hypothetical protein LF817_00790 [Halobacillus sp. A1]|uniref:hypothetical protein n=1 Tax=Halobacillus sp. A1 TaxID=2880262 RepID=UPI0020A64590|nr:hypothetical protein [Halobacillus sp. A1]MCP3029868.1 hypothetical protein [Halobacillus sp. A1]